MKVYLIAALGVVPLLVMGAPKKKSAAPEKTSLEQYVQEVNQRSHQSSSASPGSLYSAGGRLADGFRDVRASQALRLGDDNRGRQSFGCFDWRNQHLQKIECQRIGHILVRPQERNRSACKSSQCHQ